jgi:hypothetical protein
MTAHAPIWDEAEREHEIEGQRVIDDAASVGGWIFAAFAADELESRELPE